MAIEFLGSVGRLELSWLEISFKLFDRLNFYLEKYRWNVVCKKIGFVVVLGDVPGDVGIMVCVGVAWFG